MSILERHADVNFVDGMDNEAEKKYLSLFNHSVLLDAKWQIVWAVFGDSKAFENDELEEEIIKACAGN